MGVGDKIRDEAAEVERARAMGAIAAQVRTTKELRALVRGLTDELEETRRDLAVALGTGGAKPIKLRPAKAKAGAVTPVCLWSDWHIEEVVEAYATAGRNEYNPEIARLRYERLMGRTVERIQQAAKWNSVGEIVVWLGGDFMSGHIHADLVEVTASSPTETAVQVYDWLREGLLYVADATKCRVLVPTSYGNHGRITTGKPRIATAASHNLEQMVYQSLARDLKPDDRFVFDITKTAFKYLDLGNYVLRFNHGDAFRYGGGIGGIHVPLQRAIGRWNAETPAQVTCIGHWHQRLDLEHSVANGSLIGTSEYSRRFGFEEPSQQMFLVERSARRKGAVFPLWVD